MVSKLVKLHILSHALEYYLKREGASQKDIRQELAVLNEFDYVYRFDQQKNSDFKDWLDGFKTEALQTLVNMHQFGYTVEKEKRYRVKLKGTSQYLREDDGETWFSSFFISDFTRNDIKYLGFGWVFDCPGIEIEEVE